MSKMTIAQQRDKAIDRLMARKSNNTFEDYQRVRKIMNSYYRLVGLCNRLLAFDNTSGVYNERRSTEMHLRENRWFKRLNKQLAEFDVELMYSSWFPTIVKKGTTQDLYLTYFYD